MVEKVIKEVRGISVEPSFVYKNAVILRAYKYVVQNINVMQNKSSSSRKARNSEDQIEKDPVFVYQLFSSLMHIFYFFVNIGCNFDGSDGIMVIVCDVGI